MLLRKDITIAQTIILTTWYLYLFTSSQSITDESLVNLYLSVLSPASNYTERRENLSFMHQLFESLALSGHSGA